MSLKNFLHPACIFAITLTLSCAGQIAPSGGPVDSIPPIIIRTEPDSNAVRVQPETITLEFSEYVDRRSVEESIFISPYLGELEFEWSGREVEILFTERFRERTTYVVNVGTDVLDVRARNRMSSGFTLAFSTGDSIDRGSIRGKVFDEKAEGVMMFAYALDGISPDTLDPSKAKPDYIVQTGKDGLFALSNLRWGAYRVFAVRDEYKNLIYDKQNDQFGVTIRDIVIDEKKPIADELWFRLSAEDTTKPFLTKVLTVNGNVLQLRFSEQLDSVSFASATIVVSDTISQQRVGITQRSLERGDSTLATLITASRVDSGRGYRLTIEGVKDRIGNLIDSASASYAFGGYALRDTVKPRFTIVGVQDSVREIRLESKFEIRFTEPVVQNALANAISLVDSTRKKVATSLSWLSLSTCLLTPQQPLESKRWYSIRVVMDSVRDFSNNSYKDSVNATYFQSLDLKTTGTIEGFVIDSDSSKLLGDIVLTVKKVLTAESFERTTRLAQPGEFKFEQMPEGRYTLNAFRDRDSSQSYSFGKPFPFQLSERFTTYSDTIKVRARWGVEGVSVVFRRK